MMPPSPVARGVTGSHAGSSRVGLYARLAGIGRLSALLLVMAATGCATIDPAEQCHGVDWHAVGYADGAAGQVAGEALARRRPACTRLDISPDEAAYGAGYEAGLRAFCVADRGLALGRAGQPYHGVCPAETEPAFLVAYETGREHFQTQEHVRATERTLLIRQQQLDAVEVDRKAVQSELIDDWTSPERRRELLGVLYDLKARKRSLENEMAALRVELEQHRESLAATAPVGW